MSIYNFCYTIFNEWINVYVCRDIYLYNILVCTLQKNWANALNSIGENIYVWTTQGLMLDFKLLPTAT